MSVPGFFCLHALLPTCSGFWAFPLGGQYGNRFLFPHTFSIFLSNHWSLPPGKGTGNDVCWWLRESDWSAWDPHGYVGLCVVHAREPEGDGSPADPGEIRGTQTHRVTQPPVPLRSSPTQGTVHSPVTVTQSPVPLRSSPTESTVHSPVTVTQSPVPLRSSPTQGTVHSPVTVVVFLVTL